MYKIAEKKDLESLAKFLTRPDIDNSFVLPLTKRGINVGERVQKKYENGKWILAYNMDNNIVGCCAVVSKDKDVELSTYVVDANYRGLGIGSTLFDMALDIAKTYPENYRILFDSWIGSGISGIAVKRGFIKTREFYGDSKRPQGMATVEYEYKR